MKQKRFLCGLSALLLGIFLSACGKESESAVNEYRLGEVRHSAEDPVQEQEIPSWQTAFTQSGGEILHQKAPLLFDGGILQFATIKDADQQTGSVYQIYSFETGEWESLNLPEAGTTADGFAYRNIGQAFLSASGELCCLLYTDTETRAAALSADGVGRLLSETELSGALSGELYAGSEQLFLSGSELFLWRNSNTSIRISDIGTNRADIVRISTDTEPETVQADGWIHGAIQREDGVFFYGVDQEELPAMWRADGTKQNAVFPKELAATEFYAADVDGELMLLDRYALWTAESEEKLYSFMENGYSFTDIYGLTACEDGKVRILAEMDGQLFLLTYDPEKREIPSGREEIVLAMSMQNVSLNCVIADFNRHSSDYYITVVYPGPGESIGTFITRMQMELSAGKGADLLEEGALYHPTAMKESGWLACLDGLGFEESGCLSAALETGKLDGSLYGIPYECSLDFAAYRSSLSGKRETVGIEELMKAVRASDAKVLDPACNELEIVMRYAMRDETDTTYIDWKKGKSHLTEKPFLELLEFAREYAADGRNTYEKDEVFAAHPFNEEFTFSSFQNFSQTLGDYVILGYPSEKGSGIYMTTNKIYLNSRAKGKEGCIAFLKYLVSSRAQALYTGYDIGEDADLKKNADGFFVNHPVQFPVNAQILEVMLEKEDGNNPENQFVLDSGEILYLKQPLTGEQLEIFDYMIGHAQPANYAVTPLADIFAEELDAYFEGYCTAEEAAEKLDNRVQLYLDEQ